MHYDALRTVGTYELRHWWHWLAWAREIGFWMRKHYHSAVCLLKPCTLWAFVPLRFPDASSAWEIIRCGQAKHLSVASVWKQKWCIAATTIALIGPRHRAFEPWAPASRFIASPMAETTATLEYPDPQSITRMTSYRGTSPKSSKFRGDQWKFKCSATWILRWKQNPYWKYLPTNTNHR